MCDLLAWWSREGRQVTNDLLAWWSREGRQVTNDLGLGQRKGKKKKPHTPKHCTTLASLPKILFWEEEGRVISGVWRR
jgi:hypothetical protein